MKQQRLSAIDDKYNIIISFLRIFVVKCFLILNLIGANIMKIICVVVIIYQNNILDQCKFFFIYML